jgi:hypothetical protein
MTTVLFSRCASLAASEQPNEEPRPKVQMAILLDSSSSMTGLIDQARAHLWKVVNQFIDADLGGQKPVLEVALLEYGAGRLPAERGYTRLVVPLTNNLDKISEELSALTAVGRPGGSLESCGQIIELAVKRLDWSRSPKDLKCIFIAGNEEFTQGPVDFRQACRAAANQGITVSTVFCGERSEGVRLLWQEAAKLADGSFLNINHNEAPQVVETPQDKALAELNARLNQTYLAYGEVEARRAATRRQLEQDAEAAKLPSGANAERARFKGSALYRNESWDLVDALQSGKVKLNELNDEQLPDNLRKLPAEKRQAYVDQLAKTRAELQSKIAELSKKRGAYLKEEQQNRALPSESALDKALIDAVQQQAEKKNLHLKTP